LQQQRQQQQQQQMKQAVELLTLVKVHPGAAAAHR
jgi:hypothetical protein